MAISCSFALNCSRCRPHYWVAVLFAASGLILSDGSSQTTWLADRSSAIHDSVDRGLGKLAAAARTARAPPSKSTSSSEVSAVVNLVADAWSQGPNSVSGQADVDYFKRLPSRSSEIDGDIDGFIKGMVFAIPDGLIPNVSVASSNFSFRGLILGNISIGSLTSTASPAEEAAGLVRVNLSNLAATCVGQVLYQTPFFFLKSGSFPAIISTHSAELTAQLRLSSTDSSAPVVPDIVKVETCNTVLGLSLDIEDKGWQALTKLLPQLKDALNGLINQQLQTLLCGDGVTSGEKALNDFLASTRSMAEGLIRIPAAQRPQSNDSYVALDKEPILAWAEEAQYTSMESKVIRNITDMFYGSDGRVCLVASPGDPNPLWCLLSSKDPICLLGGANASGCYFKQPLSASPPVDLTVNVDSAYLVLGNSTLGLGQVNGTVLPLRAGSSQMEIIANLSLRLDASIGGIRGKDLGGNLMLRLSIDGAMFEAALNAVLDKERFLRLPEVSRIVPSCLMRAVQGLEVLDFDANFSTDTAVLQLLGMLDPGQPSSSVLSGGVEVLAAALGAIVGVGGSSVAPLLQGALRKYALSAGSEYLAKWLKTEQQETLSCPEPMEDQTFEHSTQRMIDPGYAQKCNFWAALVGGAGLLLGVFTAVIGFRRRRRQSRNQLLLAPFEGNSANGVQALGSIAFAASSVAAPGRHREYCVSPLCLSQSVPWSVGLAVPLVIGSLLLFLLGSNFMQLAETYLILREVNLDEDSILGRSYKDSTRVWQMMIYSLFYSIYRLKDAEMPNLANLVFVFSGILPYTKLFMMLVCWLLPMPRKLRGAVLLTLDQIGKFSLVDVFVIQFISCTLAVTFGLPNDRQDGLEPSIVMRSNLTSGFLAFVLATVGSLLVGHCCLYFHKKDHIKRISERRRELECSTSCRSACSWLVGAQLLFLFVAFTVGGFLPAFTVQIESPFFELSHSTHSFFGFMVELPHYAENPRSAATRFGQIVFMLFGVFTIYGHLLVLILFHFVGISKKRVAIAATCAQTLAAWSSLDVVILSMVVTLVEMTSANFLYLNGPDRDFIGRLVHHPVSEIGLPVNIELQAGTYVLGAVAVLHWLVRPQVMGPLERAVEEAAADAELPPEAALSSCFDDAPGQQESPRSQESRAAVSSRQDQSPGLVQSRVGEIENRKDRTEDGERPAPPPSNGVKEASTAAGPKGSSADSRA